VGAAPRIPGIEIGAELGHGAYSVVYRARQGQTECALKLPHVAGQWTRWVYREGVALARVRHPGLPAMFEVGEAEGLPYLLMELVEGETLAERLRRGILAADVVLDLGCQLTDALRALHEIGLVHRDVKPRNVILDRSGKARLVDLGFVVPAGANLLREEAGTRRYSAPEQFDAVARIDGRADLYALGRVLGQCLTGDVGLRVDARMALTELTNAGVSSSVARVITALIAEDPDDRYPDAQAVLSELHRVRAGGVPRGPQAFEPARLQPPLVARDSELERFTHAWRHVGTGGRVVFVEGVPGSGKSRFLHACKKKVAEEGRGRTLESACREGDSPLYGMRRLLQSYLASAERLPPQERAAAMTALQAAATGPLGSLVAALAPELAELLEASPQLAAPDAFAEGIAEFLVRLAKRSGPLLLEFDDIQWMDVVSGKILAAVADRANEAPLLVLAASRPTSASCVRDVSELSHAVRIPLGPLELRQTTALVASHLGVPSVEPGIIRRIAAVAEHTPVGVLEVLGAYLDAGALRLRGKGWVLHEEGIAQVALPEGARAYLGRRAADLPPATRLVLEAAAILGTIFDDEVLARVVELDLRDVDFALADGRLLGLLEPEGQRRHRFGHDSLRELLSGKLDEAARRRLHQRAAMAYASLRGANAEHAYACALHFAAGEMREDPAAGHHAALQAADVAIERFDDETALRFLEISRKFAEMAGLPLDLAFHRRVGEASLSMGMLVESLHAFESARDLARTDVERAILWGRISWVRRARHEHPQSWLALEQAFSSLGIRTNEGGAPPSTSTAPRPTRAAHSADVVNVLFELYHHQARLAAESGRPAHVVQSAMRVLELADASEPSVAQARAHSVYAASLVIAGQRKEAEREFAAAQQIVSRLGDPAATAFLLGRRVLGFSWAGKFDAALDACRLIAEDYAPWVELGSLCDVFASADMVESVRGRANEASAWILRATDRLRRGRHIGAVFPGFIALRARATLAATERLATLGPWLEAQIAASEHGNHERPYYRLLCWGPRARYLVEIGELGAIFEELVAEFRKEGHKPGQGHMTLVEYYLAVAHGRLQQCLGARSDERPARVAALRDAAADLRAAARLPVLEAHAVLVDGALAWLEGDLPKARRLLAKAEVIASSETCPWVTWGVARIRAHMLREKGKLEAALDQARIAEVLARAHGAEARAACVRNEFSLPPPETHALSVSAGPSLRSSRRARRQLASLLNLVRAPQEQLKPSQQALIIADDLARELGAERVYLTFDPVSDRRSVVIVGRNRLGETLGPPDGWREAAMNASRTEGDVLVENETNRSITHPLPPDRTRVAALPLVLRDRPVGALLVERSPADPPFTAEDHELLLLLSHQVPLGLELARLLGERDHLHATMQQAQKMEVVGQLAGSAAHDFNNMLSIIRSNVFRLLESADLDPDSLSDLEAVRDAEQRAAQLAGKLLSLSRQQKLKLGALDVNAAIAGVHALLERAVPRSQGFTLVVDPARESPHALTDAGSFDQALLNLAVNARDAMPGGGTLRIATRSVVLGSDAVARGAPAEGEYVAVEVSDTGQGIPPEHLGRVFDPFFTTKPAGKGTGLGLTSVYAFVRQCGGHIEVESEVGQGTTFRIYLPKSEHAQVAEPAPPPSPPPPVIQCGTPPMVLVVDDDPAVRRITCDLLQHGGYRVLAASNSVDALRFAETRRDEISLVILDMQMPGMSGRELSRRLADMRLTAKTLFVTGAVGDSEEDEDGRQPVLSKPFSSDDLLRRVRSLLIEGLN
jgi:signal transduction histidine kinase/CheY-like chemotaxis protein